MLKKINNVFFLLILLSHHAVSNDTLELNNATTASEKVVVLLKMANTLRYSEPKESEKYATRALQLTEQTGDKIQIANTLNTLGFLHLMAGQHQVALEEFKRSLKVSEEANNESQIAISYNNLGNYYNYRGLKDKALKYYLRSLKLKEAIGDERAIAVNLTNIGIIYDEQGKYEKALKNYEKALEIKNKLNDERGVALVSSNIGALHSEYKQSELAIRFLASALKIYRKFEDLRGIKNCLQELAALNYRHGDLKKAFDLLSEAQKINEQLNDFSGLSAVHSILSQIYTDESQLELALKHAEQSVSYAVKAGDLEAEAYAWQQLSVTLESLGNLSEALKAYQKSTSINDSLQSTQTNQYIEKLQVEYETELKDRKLNLQEKDIALLNKDKKLRLYLIGALVLIVILISTVFFTRYKRQQIRLRSEEAERKLAEAENRLLEETKSRLSKEVELRNKELLSFTMQTAQKNEMIQQLEEDITSTIKSIESSDDAPRKKINKLFVNLQNTEKDWDEFKLRFEQVEQNFLHKLQTDFPELSATDLRICALIRINLSSKEIAAMLNIAHDSVNKSRYRLRIKLGLDKEQDLTQFIMQL